MSSQYQIFSESEKWEKCSIARIKRLLKENIGAELYLTGSLMGETMQLRQVHSVGSNHAMMKKPTGSISYLGFGVGDRAEISGSGFRTFNKDGELSVEYEFEGEWNLVK